MASITTDPFGPLKDPLIRISLSATNANSVAADQFIFALMVMLPDSVESLVVSNVTLPSSRVPSSRSSPPSPELMVIFSGSRRRVPQTPSGARRSAIPEYLNTCLLETSTKPPLPLEEPPRAEISPAKSVNRSDHNTTLPPSPSSSASTEMWVLASAMRVWADCSWPCPKKSPPIRINPPPASPLALIEAPSRTISEPVISTCPPRIRGRLDSRTSILALDA